MHAALEGEALRRAYSPSSLVADLNPWLAVAASESAAVHAALADRARVGLSYGPDPAQRLDLFHPGGAPRACLVYIHGGYWQVLSAAESAMPAPFWLAQGIAYAALDYRLAPGPSLDDIVADVRAAGRFLRENAVALGLDAARLVVAGHSAGAHLAAMALLDAEPAFAAGVLLGGVFDLDPIRRCYVNDALGLDEAAVARLSPLRHAAPGRPLVVAWAERDTDAFKDQSRALAAAWGGVVPPFEQAGRNHFDSPFDLAYPGTALFQHTLALLKGPDRHG